MAMIHCKECGAEISKSAKVCPQCGKKQKKTSVVGIIFGVLLVIIGIGLVYDAGNDITTNSTTSTEASAETTTQSFASTSVVTKENYDKIQKGMTKAEVESILGEPASVSENETPRIRNNGIKSFPRSIFIKSYRCILCWRQSIYEKLDRFIKIARNINVISDTQISSSSLKDDDLQW